MLVLHLMLVISPKNPKLSYHLLQIYKALYQVVHNKMFYISIIILFAKYKVRHCDLLQKCYIQNNKTSKMQCIWVSYQEMQFHFIIIKTVHTVPIIFGWYCRSLRVEADMAYFYEKIRTSLHHSTLLLHDSRTTG